MSERERALARGAIPADPSKHAPHNSYSAPGYYEDIEFTCRDCGVEEVWTAQQQQWYYEVVQGPIYGQAVRCRDCRRKLAARKEQQRQQMAAAQRRLKPEDT